MNEADREQLVLTHLFLVERIARRMVRRVPGRVDLHELESAGTIGLIEASHRYDPSSIATFRTFASHRVHGAIVDQMRADGPLTRHQHRRAIETGDYVAPWVTFDSRLVDEQRHSSEAGEWVDPLFGRRLRPAMAELPRRLRQLLVWRYWHGLTLDQCGRRLGVKESRACQLEKQAVNRLRAEFEWQAHDRQTGRHKGVWQ